MFKVSDPSGMTSVRTEQTKVARVSATYMLLLLSGVSFLNAVDKLILAILVEPVKTEFGLSDGQMGMLTGLAISVSTAIAMIPVGMLADKTNRRNLVAICLLIWSSLTALGGMAQSYLQLLVSRMLVGFGEAGGGPPALSIISDLFPRAKRATALSIFYVAAPIGHMTALAAGGWIADHYGWRATLVAAGAPGVLLATLLFCTGFEPVRGASDIDKTPTGGAGLSEALRYILSCRSLLHLGAGITLVSFALSGLGIWAPAYLVRSHGMPLQQVGPILAVVQGAAVVGPILGATFADRLAAKDRRWWCWIVAIGVGCGAAVLPAFTLAADVRVALPLFGVFTLMMSIWYGPSYGAVQTLAPPQMRATITAIFYVVGNVAGFGMGTQFIGIVSDILESHAGIESLRYALTTLALICMWAAAHFISAARTLEDDLVRQ